VYHNYIFDSVNDALPALLMDLRKKGEHISSRAGGTHELMHVGTTLTTPLFREILVPGRKASVAAQIAETAWILAGRSDIDWLVNYLPRAREFSDDGQGWRAGYGQRLRAWPRRDGSGDTIDQYRWVVDHLKQKPSSRQAVMSIWDPAVDTTPGKDIPCNDWLSFSSRLGRLDLHVAVRSNDIIWGWSGINQFEWSTLLEVTAGLLGVGVGSLHFSTTSLHLYDHHLNRAQEIADSMSYDFRFGKTSPRFDPEALESRDVDGLDALLDAWFALEAGIRLGADCDRAVDQFPEPMLRSWLRVLQWWWTGDRDYLQPIEGTNLALATEVGVQPPARENPLPIETSAPTAITEVMSDFLAHAINIHDAKSLAYGNSWKRRGETIGIMANIARKVDRLGGAETADETSADTALDLMVYLAKYLCWIYEQRGSLPSGASDSTDFANNILKAVESHDLDQERYRGNYELETYLRNSFDDLSEVVQSDFVDSPLNRREPLVRSMLRASYVLARRLYEAS
jgi:thymidylate synthase